MDEQTRACGALVYRDELRVNVNLSIPATNHMEALLSHHRARSKTRAQVFLLAYCFFVNDLVDMIFLE